MLCDWFIPEAYVQQVVYDFKPPHGRPYSSQSGKVVPLPLAQTGEGIKECELTAWYVKVSDPCSSMASQSSGMLLPSCCY